MTHEEYARQLLKSAASVAPAEWAPVLFFYAVLHATSHALYRGSNAQNTDHFKREVEIDAAPTLRKVLANYRQLRKASEDVRYRPWVQPRGPSFVAHATTMCAKIFESCGIQPDA